MCIAYLFKKPTIGAAVEIRAALLFDIIAIPSASTIEGR
jgi:hypothetical protein